MASPASDLARRLGENAEAVCRHYLSNGRREGRYWLIGDVLNTPGRSLYVRLHGPEQGPGAPGKWTDAATGEHGDLLDLIAVNRGLTELRGVLVEARAFLSLPKLETARPPPAPTGSPEAARRLFAMSKPVQGTVAEVYLHRRGITAPVSPRVLRFHPRCWYRSDHDEHPVHDAWPALIAAVTDLQAQITGAHRTWLDPTGRTKAPVSSPRRAMGHLLGAAVRFGVAHDVMAAGEGLETVLSVRQVLPSIPAAAALSANHLAALVLPTTLRRLYIAEDADPAGRGATLALAERTQAQGIEALTLRPVLGDFNDDLCTLGPDALAAGVRVQLAAEDVARFWRPPTGKTVQAA